MKPPDFELVLLELSCLHVPVADIEENCFLCDLTHEKVKLCSEQIGSAVGQHTCIYHPLVFINDNLQSLF